MSENKCNHSIDKGFEYIRNLPGEIYMCECGALYRIDPDDEDAVIVLSPDDLVDLVSQVIKDAIKKDSEYQPVDLRSPYFRP